MLGLVWELFLDARFSKRICIWVIGLVGELYPGSRFSRRTVSRSRFSKRTVSRC